MRTIVAVGCMLSLAVASGCRSPYAKISSPVNLGPNVNSAGHEGSPDISADGRSLYFDALRPGGLGGWDIWLSEANSPHADFGVAAPLAAPVNSRFDDSGPCISDDGLTLYFASNRPGGSGDFDIWMTTRTTAEGPWTEPVNLGPIVNSSAYDNHPSISSDGLTLYFDSRRPNDQGQQGINDIYRCRRATIDDPWGAPEALAINTNGIEYSPDISSDNRTLYYDSPLAGRDLWISKRSTASEDWERGVNMGSPFNTRGIDTDPSISANAPLLYFVSNRPGGEGGFDIWMMYSMPKKK